MNDETPVWLLEQRRQAEEKARAEQPPVYTETPAWLLEQRRQAAAKEQEQGEQ